MTEPQPQASPGPAGAPDPGGGGPAQHGGAIGSPAGRGIDSATLRRRSVTRNLVGWLVMVGLVLTVALASYMAVNALADRVGGLPRPEVPGLPELPGGDGGPLGWLGGLFGGNEEIYIVNIADGLNLRREPDAGDPANVIVVVPNGTPVRKLEGPRVEGNIPWLRVRADVDGRQVEGWMSLNYLLPKE